MRILLPSLGLVATTLLAGGCFDPTRACTSDGDCVAGGRCDPGTKSCISGSNPNDRTPPVFLIALAPPAARRSTAKLTEFDPASPDGGVDAFRRDESVVVTVSSQDRDVDAGSVRLVVSGVSNNPTTSLESQLGPCTSGSPGAGAPFCGQAAVALGSLPFDAFRGVMVLEVSGSDLSNNVGKADGGINVTRWKWRYSAGAPIYTTPAIADDGTIVFGTSDGGSGSLYALTPEGDEKWAPINLGPIQASPAIGSGATPSIYVAASTPAGSRINAIKLLDGHDAGTCLGSSGLGFSKPILGGLAVLSTPGDTEALESAVGLAGGTRLVTFRPAAQGTSDPSCLEAGAPFQQSQFETVVTDGAVLYLGAQDNSLRSFVFETTSINWVRNTAWGISGAVLVGDSELSALAVDGADLVFGVHPFGLVRVARSSGASSLNGPDGGVTGDPSGTVVGQATIVFAVGTESEPLVVSQDVHTKDFETAQGVGLVRSVPSVGSDQLVYALTTNGMIDVRDVLLRQRWSASLSQGRFWASSTIDCARQSGGGVLYAASDRGELVSVLVDSAGIDSASPWPKYQHDSRNTGNPTTPIHSCP
jgi:hypothetical protein